MKKLFLFLLVCWVGLSTNIMAQSDGAYGDVRVKGEKFARNTFYIGVLGSTVPGSFNYERIISKNAVVNFGARIGGFYAPFNEYQELKVANGTFQVVFLLGKKSHLFEMGLGWSGHYGSFYSEKNMKTRFYGVPTSTFNMGYRFQKPSSGVFFKVGFTSMTILAFATNDLKELAIGNGILFALDKLTGDKPSFSLPSIGIGYSF